MCKVSFFFGEPHDTFLLAAFEMAGQISIIDDEYSVWAIVSRRVPLVPFATQSVIAEFPSNAFSESAKAKTLCDEFLVKKSKEKTKKAFTSFVISRFLQSGKKCQWRQQDKPQRG